MTPTHEHPDGGLYRLYAMDIRGKDPTTGEWVEGVLYQDIHTSRITWTSRSRWDERFTPVGDMSVSPEIVILDESESSEEEHVASFRFYTRDVSDLRHMILATNPQKNHRLSREFLSWVRRVFTAQAEMVSQGLHLRDHDFPDLIGDVNAFHAKFAQEYTGKPRVLPRDLHDFRVRFHREEDSEYGEEYEKLLDAIERKDRRDIITALEKQLDSLVDLVWVALGTADLQFGRKAFIEAWKRVVKANMAKVLATDDPNAEDSGREIKYDIRKPAGWLPPDHRDLVEDNAAFDELFGESEADPPVLEHPTGNYYSDTRAV